MTRQGIDEGQGYVKASSKGVTHFFLGEKKGKEVVEKVWDQYQYLGKCPPTPPLTQHLP